ncbi:membrane-bound lytic murein transglycosylase A [Cohaesibacter sp. ES.047]|uniref:murein transglycosylase A n=1 Tax=Cohaesibacter sp. ES.047 TaxID=1798205 RepID=UPI000BB96954|nr:MltA domain-containing protein [Cohaesibacter sp. ES.047]SNY90510.1 membrane-bound lytic murein transglycosylase A [Cohaesibacter sp. ES.047]
MAGRTNISFADLAGWTSHDHEAAFAAFWHSARAIVTRPPTMRAGSAASEDLVAIARLALECEGMGRSEARAFFEDHFTPVELTGPELLTGYYEPVFEGRRSANAAFSVPLHKRPSDLIAISADEASTSGFTPETSFARKTPDGLQLHLSRKDIMAGGLDDEGLELVWLKSAIDAYIIHIQGSARIILEDGSQLRVGFDGKSGHPYRSIGKILIEKGVFTPDSISMDTLMEHVRSSGADGLSLLAENPSYIFFKEMPPHEDEDRDMGPIAAAGNALIPMRSIAVDRHVHTFGLPFWLESTIPTDSEPIPFHQLVFAHDTGSAIKGAARGDLFTGSGPEAGRLAGRLNAHARFVALMPDPSALRPLTDGGENG